MTQVGFESAQNFNLKSRLGDKLIKKSNFAAMNIRECESDSDEDDVIGGGIRANAPIIELGKLCDQAVNANQPQETTHQVSAYDRM